MKVRTGSGKLTRATVNRMLTVDNELRDLSNMSFVFNELHHEFVNNVAFSPTGEEVAACGKSGSIKVSVTGCVTGSFTLWRSRPFDAKT